ncbi:MAG: hypothetical protein ACQEQ8_05975 [Pseudomonadota bacterium]
MKGLLINSFAAASIMFSGSAMAQQAEQQTSSFVTEQVASISVELFNATQATVLQTLQSWGEQLLAEQTESTQVAASQSSAQEQQAQATPKQTQ